MPDVECRRCEKLTDKFTALMERARVAQGDREAHAGIERAIELVLAHQRVCPVAQQANLVHALTGE